MSALAVFVVAAIGSYAFRASMVVGGAGTRLDGIWAARLGLVAPVVLSAIVASAMFLDGTDLNVPTGPEVVAVALAAAAVRRTGALAAAFVVGFPTYWALAYLT